MHVFVSFRSVVIANEQPKALIGEIYSSDHLPKMIYMEHHQTKPIPPCQQHSLMAASSPSRTAALQHHRNKQRAKELVRAELF